MKHYDDAEELLKNRDLQERILHNLKAYSDLYDDEKGVHPGTELEQSILSLLHAELGDEQQFVADLAILLAEHEDTSVESTYPVYKTKEAIYRLSDRIANLADYYWSHLDRMTLGDAVFRQLRTDPDVDAPLGSDD